MQSRCSRHDDIGDGDGMDDDNDTEDEADDDDDDEDKDDDDDSNSPTTSPSTAAISFGASFDDYKRQTSKTNSYAVLGWRPYEVGVGWILT